MKTGIILFVIGLVVGVAAGVLVPRWAGPHLPQVLQSGDGPTEGTVVAKLRRDGQLLLTVDTGDGAVLATFTQRLEEITLLVDEGDTVSLGLPHYEPFADDPPIVRVVKKKEPVEEEAPAPEPAAPPGVVEEGPAPADAEPAAPGVVPQDEDAGEAGGEEAGEVPGEGDEPEDEPPPAAAEPTSPGVSA